MDDQDAFAAIHDAIGEIKTLETLHSIVRLVDIRLEQLAAVWRRDLLIDTVKLGWGLKLTTLGREYILGYDGVEINLMLHHAPLAGKSRIKLDSDFGFPASEIEIITNETVECINTGWPKSRRKTILAEQTHKTSRTDHVHQKRSQ